MRVVDLPGEIVMVPSRTLDSQLRQRAVDHPGVPVDVRQIQLDLNGRQSVSVSVDQPRSPGSDPSLLVHGSTYVVRLFLRPHGDAYTIASVSPLRMRDHHRLAKGCLLLQRVRWRVVYTPMEIPEGSRSHWQTLLDGWSRLADGQAVRSGSPALSAAHRDFLDTVSRVIDAIEKISEKTERAQLFTYRKVAPTGEVRHTAQSVYEFQMVGDVHPDRGTIVQVRGEPGQRGQVTRVGESVTIKFEDPIDFQRIPQQGQLEVTPNAVVHKTRREAVNVLRDRQARNTGLLPVLVDNRIQRFAPATEQPTDRLDDDQLEAFRKAIAVPDTLLVLGPPGTGKTRTISEIVNASATRTAAGRDCRRVLVTAHTNRAVDNILPRLPAGLLTIRVGSETLVTEDGKPYLLELRASELRQEILNGTEPTRTAYENHAHAARWAVELDQRLRVLTAALTRESQASAALDHARRVAGGPAQLAVDNLTANLKAGAAKVRRNEERAARWTRRRERASTRVGRPVIGGYYRMTVRRAERRLAVYRSERDRLGQTHQRISEELSEAWSRLDAATRDVPAVRAALSELDAAVRDRVGAVAASSEAARACCVAVTPMAVPPPVRTDADPVTLQGDLDHLASWLRARLPVFEARARLLDEWHTEVSGETRQLYPELIRYADVIAATAIGSGSRPELSDVDFDLAVVDEAGQIGIPDILVPLVRVKRAVIVGDHRQLPPFLDTEVKNWGVAEGDPAVEALLTKSALELLVERFPSSNVVPLTWQRRMPAVVADFISSAFYAGQLHTDVRRRHRDPLFARQFAFVDTADLPASRRRETRTGQEETAGRPGIVNVAEAELLVRLAAHYHRLHADWAVIVPYKAQVELIQSRLAPIVGSSATVELNVGTVDAFQGGERDVILYGFTRSNSSGSVGFLDELRRGNVAFTRAKRQLTLVGDLRMLANANETQFRELIQALRVHLLTHGDIWRYQDIWERLANVEKGH